MPATKKLVRTHKRGKPKHTKKTYKLSKSKNVMTGGSLFGFNWFGPSNKTKFLAQNALKKIQNSSYDELTKKYITKGFYKIFELLQTKFKSMTLKIDDANEMKFENLFDFKVENHNNTYTIEYKKDENGKNIEKGVKILTDKIIPVFVNLLSKSESSTYNTNKADINKIKQPNIYKSSTDKYSQTYFYEINNSVNVDNVFSSLSTPYVPARTYDKKGEKMVLYERQNIAKLFYNNANKYCEALKNLILYYNQSYKDSRFFSAQ